MIPYEYLELKKRLQELDGNIYQERWAQDEYYISRADRMGWLLFGAWKKALCSSALFFALMLAMILVFVIYDAATSPVFFFRALKFNIEELYHSSINGGAISIMISSAVPLFAFLIFSTKIKHDGIFNLDMSSSISGSFGSSNGVERSVVNGAIWSAIIFYIASLAVNHSQLGSWWQAAIAGGLSFHLMESALEKVADAVNVARTGTISRKGGIIGNGPRRYI